MASEVTKTIGVSGRDYATITLWEAQNLDLVSLDQIQIGECYNDAAFSEGFTVTGWVADATRYLKLTTGSGQRHSGIIQTGVRVLNPNNYQYGWSFSQDYFQVIGIEFDCNNTSGITNKGGIGIAQYVNDLLIDKCIIWGFDGREALYAAYSGGGMKLYMSNSIIHPNSFTAGTVALSWNADDSVYFYNNSIINTDGICLNMSSGPNFRAKNNIGKNSAGTNAFNGTFHADSDYNASSDATDAGGAHARNNQTFSFIDESNHDYHLALGDLGAKGFGIDLFGDPNFPVTDDIDGVSRVIPFDIGADQITLAGAMAKIYPHWWR